MDYLVVAPHTPFFQWQVALIIQSFRLQKIEENLAVLLVASEDKPIQSNFCNHFVDHPRLRAIRLPCDSDPDIIRLHGIEHAVKTGFVNPTFASLPVYSVLRHPISSPIAQITFSYKPEFTFQHLESFGISSRAISKRMMDKKQWIPVGDVLLFDKLTDDFYHLAKSRGEMIAFDSKRELLKENMTYFPRAIFRAAMSFAIMETYGNLTLDTTRHLEAGMQENDSITPIINYDYGSPPEFSRNFYKKETLPIQLSDNPFNGILRTQETLTAVYMKMIVKSLASDSENS